jgi:ribonuclease HI
LLKALELIAEKATGKVPGNISDALVRSDSKLVVNQVNGEWRVEDERLMELSEKAREMIENLGSVRLEWVPRDENYAGLWLEGKLKPFSVERLPA